jgi:hypothetical protein
VVEPYRQRIFTDALYSFEPDGTPRYSLVLCGRAAKNRKSAEQFDVMKFGEKVQAVFPDRLDPSVVLHLSVKRYRAEHPKAPTSRRCRWRSRQTQSSGRSTTRAI